MQASLAAPERVAGLALLGAVVDGVPWDRESAQAMDEAGRQAKQHGVLAGRAAWLAHPLLGPASERPELAGQLTAMVAGYPCQHFTGRDPHRHDQVRPLDALEQLTMPVLVAVGDRDVPCFRDMSNTLARGIRGARLQVISDAGHMINMEQPAAVNDLLAGFLDQLPAHRSAPAGRATREGRRRTAR
jgi:3-oxoadipate enol-lactonase